MHRYLHLFLAIVTTICFEALTVKAADGPPSTNVTWLAEHYTKFEHLIPMRDGVRLFTRVYVPKDDSQKWPILMTRTPYALKPYGENNYSEFTGSFMNFAKDKFILVSQDVRGRYGSEGAYMHVRPFKPHKIDKDTDESSDAYDTIDWLVKNIPNNNGKAGVFGISYPGFYTAMAMIDSHPALKAASPQAPISDWFMGDDIHHNGAFFLSQNFGFFHAFAQRAEDPLHEELKRYNFKTPDGYDFYLRMGPLTNSITLLKDAPEWREFLSHPTYDDYWQARNIRPHLKNIKCAVMTVGGWYDAEDLFGPLEIYRGAERMNPGITNMLVMGPWSHGAWGRSDGDKLGDINFRAKTGEYYREKIELPFFRHYLKGDTNFVPTEVHVFETGTHQWRKFDEWPPKESTPRTFHLVSANTLSFDSAQNSAAASFDEFVSDPAKPVPYTLEFTTDYPRGYPTHDQRFAASRPDVLTYETEPLENDLTLVGPIKVTLHVATTGTDADWVVKLIDVYAGDFPDANPNPAHVAMGGYQQLVRGDVFRGKFRNSFEKPEPFEPNKVTKIEFTMPDILHTFRRNHRVMIHVQGSWFPLVDRNPQTFVNIPTAKESDFKKATHRVYHNSTIAVNVLAP